MQVISRKEAEGSVKVPACSKLMPDHELSIDGKTKAYMLLSVHKKMVPTTLFI